ncbi:uncharacterized protein LOC142539284 [Primulina tabacum]|uniref:uncharacterized protein LOC142539284 n=1 Tax=Primulina tabacum TaxID=48773 RepID=UPI003F594587
MLMDSPFSSSSHVSVSTPSPAAKAPSTFLSVECIKSGGWMAGDKPQTGDIVEEIRIGDTIVISEFEKGRSGVQKILGDSFRRKETRIRVRVRRGPNVLSEMQGCIVPGNGFGWKKQYVMRGVDDPNHALGFVDRTESDCLRLQAARISRLLIALERTKLEDGYVLYPWEKRTREMLLIPNSSSFYSILFLPRTSEKAASRYNDLEDTLARANAWIITAQASGVPVLFTNIQTESLLTKISGETASPTVNSGSLTEMSKVANASLYGFEDYHGVDIGMVRAVRLWFSPQAGEIPVEIKVQETDTKLGFAISRTEEGFIYISSAVEDDDVPSARSGISKLFKQAFQASQLLVVSRISNQKVLPWMVSSTGAIRCFDTVSLSHKLSLHRHAKATILLHVFLWGRSSNFASIGNMIRQSRTVPNTTPEVHSKKEGNENRIHHLAREADSGEISIDDESDIMLERNSDGHFSFRLNDFSFEKVIGSDI